MRHRRMMPMSNIKADRLPIGPKILSLIAFISNGGQIPPIHLQRPIDGGSGVWNIVDGRHRYLAYKLLGRTEIESRYGTEPHIKVRIITSSGQCLTFYLRGEKNWTLNDLANETIRRSMRLKAKSISLEFVP